MPSIGGYRCISPTLVMVSTTHKPKTISSAVVVQHPYNNNNNYYYSKVKCKSEEAGGSHNRRSWTYRVSEEGYAEEGVRKELMPQHVGFLLDGNRRWCKAHAKPLDYSPFFQANALAADCCLKWGVPTASSFISSFNNLQRGKEHNDLLFGHFETFLADNMENFIRKNVRVSMIGERRVLPGSLQSLMKQVEEKTREASNTKAQLELILAVCYAGTKDIVEAARNLCEKTKAGLIDPKSIDEALFDQQLSTHGTPPPDLFIRTGGRLRLSDYLTWQCAQAEFYFTDIYGPEFSEAEFLKALRSFQQRVRCFGK